MFVNSIKYHKIVSNGKGEQEGLTLEIGFPTETEIDVQENIDFLKGIVCKNISQPKSHTILDKVDVPTKIIKKQKTEVVKPVVKEEEKPVVVKEEPTKPKTTKTEVVKKEDVKPVDNGADKETTVTKEPVKEEVPAGDTASAVAEEPKKKKTRKKKAANVPYDKGTNQKVDLLCLFDDEMPGWRKDLENKTKAKDVSTKLVGVEMYSPEGQILDSFKEEFKKLCSN